VHMTTCREVSKPRGWAAGKVALGRYETVMVQPRRADEPSTAD
jgi:hypothetical protein